MVNMIGSADQMRISRCMTDVPMFDCIPHVHANTEHVHPFWHDNQDMWSGYPDQGSDQFMNWIGIDNQFNSIQHELNWNWIERFWIGIESLNWLELINSFSIQVRILQGLTFFYDILWKLQCDKQWLQWLNKHTHMLHCVPPAWGLQRSMDMKGWPFHQLLLDISNGLTC